MAPNTRELNFVGQLRTGQLTDFFRITSDVWSLALTVLEVALNRFPFPGEGEPPLNGPIELFTYVMSMPPPALKDEPGIKWSNAFRDYLRES